MFVEIEDLKTHVNEEIADAISREDDDIVVAAIEAGISEAKGYCSRFRIDYVFGVTGSDRDPVLLMHVKNLAKWHLIALANPEIDYEDARTRYDQAITWLRQVQGGKVVPEGWPPATQPKHSKDLVRIDSQPKRRNHY